MRVALVTESFLPHINGVTGSVVRVLQHLRRNGHEALVLAPGDPPKTCEGTRVVGLPSISWPGYPQVQVTVASARSIAKELAAFRPDVVHLASPFAVGGPAIRAANKLRVPVVAVYQTDVAGFATKYRLTPAADAAWRRIRSIHERAALTLAPSASAAQDLERHGVPRVRLWPRGVDTEAFSPRHRNAELRARLAPNGEVLVGYVGRLAAEKRLEDLTALTDLPGVRLVLVGDGPERERLGRLLPGAIFLGTLSGQDLSQVVASLDIAVQPGPHETFCQSAQEAMACAVPVVAVRAGGPADLVDHSRTGWLYPAADLVAMRGSVRDLAGDAAKRRAMGRAAHDAVRGRTWLVVCERLMAYYADAIRAGKVTEAPASSVATSSRTPGG